MSRGHTDDFAEEFIDAGATPEEAMEFALRYIAEGRFDESIYDVATEYMQDDVILPDIDEFISENNRIFKIGCDWEGVKEIEEYEDEKVYIPTSEYCMIKCYEKLLNRKFDRSRIHKYAATLKSMKLLLIKELVNCNCEKKHKKNCTKHKTCNCQQVHTTECQTVIDERLSDLPVVVKYGESKGKIGFHKVSNIYKNKTQAIVLVPLGNNNFHAILSKVDYKQLTKEDLKIRLTTNTELISEFKKQTPPKMKKKLPKVFVYDIETYTDDNNLVPYVLGWSEVDLVNKCFKPVTIVECNDKDYIYDIMFDQITKLPDLPDEIQLFAHNGGKFDHIYAKAATNVKFVSQISNGTHIKCLKLKCNGKTIILKDTMLFTQTSLQKSAKALHIDDDKLDFDIVNWTKEKFKQDRSWVPYLIKDVEVLAKIVLKFEEILEEFGESMTKYLGLPGLAWNLINKTCVGAKQLDIPNHKSVIDFIKQSTYGGRILHWKQKVTEEYVCLDANSLYPSAQGTSKFPIGSARIINDFTDFPKPKHVHYIVECEIEAPNIRYPIHPYRTKDNAMIFPVGRFTGVYNEVDLNEMKKDGYKIVKYIRGIYWVQSAKIFEEFVTKLYNKRVEVGSDTAIGYVLKIILNSGYGKFLEIIKSNTTFNRSRVGKELYNFELKNGQVEYSNKLLHPIVNKPIHIGSYILSYARKIMNEIINAVGRENIAYGDTDSIYVKKSVLHKVEDYLGSGLCKFKNDYGDKVITYGIFLDIKRYYLEFNDGERRCKFVGLNFKDVEKIADYQETEISDDVKMLYETLYNNYHDTDLEDQEKLVKVVMNKWKRTKVNVVIDKNVTKFMIDPKKRANWIGQEYYPIGYNHEIPEYKLEHENNIGEHLKLSSSSFSMKYRLYHNKGGNLVLETRLPLTYKKPVSVTPKKFLSSWRSDGEQVYYVHKNKTYKYTEFGYGEETNIDISKLSCFICLDSTKHVGIELSDSEVLTILQIVSKSFGC